MLEETFEVHPEVCKYSHLRNFQPRFLFYGDSVIESCEGTQQGVPKSPVFFSDSSQDLIVSLESKINLWYFYNGYLSDDYRTVLKALKEIFEATNTLGLKVKPTKCESFFLSDITENQRSKVLAASKNFDRDQNTNER